MGFQDQFMRTQQQGQSRLLDMIGAARGLAGNNPREALMRMAGNGATCTLPDGRVMRIDELVRMAEGKTPQQLLAQLGLH